MNVNFNTVNLENFIQGAKSGNAQAAPATQQSAVLKTTPLKGDTLTILGKEVTKKALAKGIFDGLSAVVFVVMSGFLISDAIKNGKAKSLVKAAAGTMTDEAQNMITTAQRKINGATELFLKNAQLTADGRKITIANNTMSEFSKDGTKVLRTSTFDKNNVFESMYEIIEGKEGDIVNVLYKNDTSISYSENAKKIYRGSRAAREISFSTDKKGKNSFILEDGVIRRKDGTKTAEKQLIKPDITKKEAYYTTNFTNQEEKEAKKGMEKYRCGKFGFWHKLEDGTLPDVPEYLNETAMDIASFIVDLFE